MPLYVYKCENCEHTFEEIVEYENREQLQDCPKCESKLGKYVNNLHKTVYSLARSFSRMRHGK